MRSLLHMLGLLVLLGGVALFWAAIFTAVSLIIPGVPFWCKVGTAIAFLLIAVMLTFTVGTSKGVNDE